jgi:hypothetical protein
MDIIESLKEQLALAHERLETEVAKNVKLKKSDVKWLNLVVKLGENAVEMDLKIEALEQTLKVAGISIESIKDKS